MTYITVPIDTDPEDLIAEAVASLQAKFPGWVPADGNLDYWLIQIMSSQGAETRDVASAVPDAIFRFFGSSVMGIPPIDEQAATTTTTWTMVDNAGYTIPAGTQVGIAVSGDETVPFMTQNEVVVPPGTTATALGAVLIEALVPGADASGIGSAGGAVQLLDPLTFVSAITMQAATSGGVDAEADDDYLQRLTDELTLLAPRPILPQDFAIMTKEVAGVARATALDGYNPADSTFNNARMVAVAAVDSLGNAVSSGVKSSIDALLQSRREVNFIVNVMDPTYTAIDVTWTAKGLTGYDPTDVTTRVNQALTQYLSPNNWGGDFFGTGVVSEDTWANQTTVRYLELAQVINGVPGVDYISALTFRKTGGTMGTTDVTLNGAIPLPTPGTLTGNTT